MAYCLKGIGAVMVFAACALAGYFYARRDMQRVNALTALRKAFVLLKGEIRYALSPLPEAFTSIAARCEPPAAQLFINMADKLAAHGDESAAALWQETLNYTVANTHLTNEDITRLAMLGQAFGYLDGATQANSLDMGIAYIDETCAALREHSAKSGRMYRSVGMLCGALIAIALL